MSDTTPAAPAEPIKNQAVALPIQINAQYTKDFSFENPRAPASLRPQSTPPHIDVNVDVQAAKAVQDEEIYEVVLKITAKGTVDNQPLFLADLTYAGLFQLQPMELADMHTALLVECPRILFPFARQIIADATRDGGFPPLMIQPVDFAAMYRQNLESGTTTPSGAATRPAVPGLTRPQPLSSCRWAPAAEVSDGRTISPDRAPL